MTSLYKAVCPTCGYIVEVRHVNSKYTRKYHHGRKGRACTGSNEQIPFESVMFQQKAVNRG